MSTVADDHPGDDTLLEVEHLTIKFFTRRGVVHAVRDVSFTVAKGETLGLVGESGSGKSVTAQALLGLTELPGKITSGDVRWKGESLVHDADATLRAVRGNEIAMVFQDPMTSLNPVFTIGMQITEVLRRHIGMNRRQARERAVELLDLVGIANPSDRVKQYAHEMSGGMRQRVLIAMALACEPQLLIADEPTTALDVTIQAQILDLIADSAATSRARGLVDHPRPRRRRRSLRPRRGDVLRQDRRAVDGRRVVCRPGSPLCRRAAAQHTAARCRDAPPCLHRRSPPGSHRTAGRLLLRPRCALAITACLQETPGLKTHPNGRKVACWRAFEVSDA